MALLKRLDGPEGSRLKKWGDYIRANQFVISIGLTLVLGLGVGLIKYLGAEGQAQEIWSYILLHNPGHADHRFRWMPSTCSDPCRPVVPTHGVQFF
jgi:hypothetical protein